MVLAEVFEVLMVVSFGIAWPSSILKSIKSKTSKGKSLLFMVVILCGYTFGICAKFALGQLTYVVIFYLINFCMVTADIVLYFINKQRDIKRDQEKCGQEI